MCSPLSLRLARRLSRPSPIWSASASTPIRLLCSIVQRVARLLHLQLYLYLQLAASVSVAGAGAAGVAVFSVVGGIVS